MRGPVGGGLLSRFGGLSLSRGCAIIPGGLWLGRMGRGKGRARWRGRGWFMITRERGTSETSAVRRGESNGGKGRGLCLGRWDLWHGVELVEEMEKDRPDNGESATYLFLEGNLGGGSLVGHVHSSKGTDAETLSFSHHDHNHDYVYATKAP